MDEEESLIKDIVSPGVDHDDRMCRYFSGRPRANWNNGWIISKTIFLFWGLRKISLNNFVNWLILRRYPSRELDWHRVSRRTYLITDSYVFIGFISAFILFILVARENIKLVDTSLIVVLVIVSYRLLEIFQTWFNNFLIISKPALRDVRRTLVLTLITYFELIFWYSILVFVNKDKFVQDTKFIHSWQQALYYGMGTATIGSDIQPISSLGFVILSSQLIFFILFLSVVISRIISLMHANK